MLQNELSSTQSALALAQAAAKSAEQDLQTFNIASNGPSKQAEEEASSQGLRAKLKNALYELEEVKSQLAMTLTSSVAVENADPAVGSISQAKSSTQSAQHNGAGASDSTRDGVEIVESKSDYMAEALNTAERVRESMEEKLQDLHLANTKKLSEMEAQFRKDLQDLQEQNFKLQNELAVKS